MRDLPLKSNEPHLHSIKMRLIRQEVIGIMISILYLIGTMPSFLPSGMMPSSVLVRHHLLSPCYCVAIKFRIAHPAVNVFAPVTEIIEKEGA